MYTTAVNIINGQLFFLTEHVKLDVVRSRNAPGLIWLEPPRRDVDSKFLEPRIFHMGVTADFGDMKELHRYFLNQCEGVRVFTSIS
jgi:hypothetical protein